MARPRMRQLSRRVWVAIAVIAIGAGLLVTLPGAGSTTVVADFASTEGIYVGDNVAVLGVPVGTITSITPTDGHVQVTMRVNSGVKIPANAEAAIIAPSLVSSRYIQLAPRYQGGSVLADGATILQSRTYVPVEWNQIENELNSLAVALGPQGANKDGSLSRLVKSANTTFSGEGTTLASTISNLSKAIGTINNGSGDLFSTIQNLQVFVSAMKDSDQQISTFTSQLDQVSGLIDDNGDSLKSAVANLGAAVSKVQGFVKNNKSQLISSLSGLADVTKIVAGQQENLAQTLQVAPNALANLVAAVHGRQNAVGVDLEGANIHSPGQLLCGAIGGVEDQSGGSKTGALCEQLLGNLLDQLASNSATTQSVQLLEQLLGLR